MLKALGVFWMEYGEIIVLTSAVVTLIGVVFTLFKNNSIANSTSDRVESKGNQLSSEHSRLNSEHSIQSIEHKSLLEKVADTKSEITEVKKTVSDAHDLRKLQDSLFNCKNCASVKKQLCRLNKNVNRSVNFYYIQFEKTEEPPNP